VLRKSRCNSWSFLHIVLNCSECTKNTGPLFSEETISDSTIPGSNGIKQNVEMIHVLCEAWKTIFGERLPVLPRHEIFRVLRSIFRRCEACLEAVARLFETLLWNEVNWTRDYKFPADTGFICNKARAYDLMKSRRWWMRQWIERRQLMEAIKWNADGGWWIMYKLTVL
jgi:hypothetical protein